MRVGERHFSSIRVQLLKRVFWVALLGVFSAVLIQTLSLHKSEAHRFQLLVGQLGRSYVPLLTLSLWDLEADVVRQQLKQISRNPEIAWVRLVSDTGLDLTFGQVQPGQHEPDARLKIPHPVDAEQSLGELQVFADMQTLDRSVLSEAIRRVLEFSLFTVLIGLVIAYTLHVELGRPLRRIARYAASLSPQHPSGPLVLHRSGHDFVDEIDLVANGFETLREGMQHYVAERERIASELAHERDQLDQQVVQRTADLQRINGYLDIFSRGLMQSLRLSTFEDYQSALGLMLEELGHYTDAKGCGLAMSTEDGVWTWQAYWDHSGQEIWPILSSLCWVADPAHKGWFTDSQNLKFKAYELQGERRSCLLVVQDPSYPDSVEERRYQKMAAEMLFALLERWFHLQQLEAQRQELELLSRSDPLTGLANRRHFDEDFQREVGRAIRYELPLSVVMLDVDYFKNYNDHFGHGQGDTCLIQIARCLQQEFQRAGELPARLGGEEFAVLLPNCTLEEARSAAERLRKAILGLLMPHPESPVQFVTVSLGVAALNALHYRQKQANGLLEQADQALYMAKRCGRNSVSVADSLAAEKLSATVPTQKLLPYLPNPDDFFR